MPNKLAASQQAVSARFNIFRDLLVGLVAIEACFTIQLNQAVNLADGLRAETQVMTDLELLDPSGETRFIGRLFSASKSYPLMIMRQKCDALTG